MSRKDQILHQLKGDILKFGKACLPNMFSLPSPEFHKDICEMFMNKKYKRMNIVAPRGHAKTSLAAGVFPLHHIFFDDQKKKVIVLSSKTQGHALNLLHTIKNALEYSMPLRTMFGYWGQHSSRIWTKDTVELKDGSVITCKGTGQQIRGLKYGDQRPTLIVLDDPEDENNTKTDTAMEWNLRWLLQSVEPALDAQTGRVIVIGTPQHQRCIVETLDGMKGWKTLRYQAVIDDKKKKVLWPEQLSYDALMEKKISLSDINRSSVFYREYQCEVVGDEDQLFSEDYLQYYDGTLELGKYGLHTLKLKNGVDIPVYTFIGVDPASSTKQTADYSTIVTIAIDANDNRYILPYYRKHAKPVDLAESIMSQYKKYKPQKVRIESVGYQEMIRDYLERRCQEKDIFIPGLRIKENPRTHKSVRLESMEPHFYRKKIFIDDKMEDLKGELLMYPRGKHDDLLDGLFYAMKGVYTPHSSETASVSDNSSKSAVNYDWAVL